MRTYELRLDVTRAAGLPCRQELAATAYLPDVLPRGEPPIVMFAIPGGGYARGYFDMHFPGHTAYSQAEHHTRAGLILIALDPLGVGASSIPDLEAVTLDTLADTYDLAVRSVLARLQGGDARSRHRIRPATLCGGHRTVHGRLHHDTRARSAPEL